MAQHKMRTFPIDQMTDPRGKGTVQIYEDRWWAVSERDELYFYGTEHSPWGSPQCNGNRAITERVANDGLVKERGDFKEVRFLPLVFVPINVNDF